MGVWVGRSVGGVGGGVEPEGLLGPRGGLGKRVVGEWVDGWVVGWDGWVCGWMGGWVGWVDGPWVHIPPLTNHVWD